MKRVIAAASLLLVAGTAACSSSSSTAHTPCVNVQLQAQMKTDMAKAANQISIPKNAAWPTRTEDLQSSPQVTDASWDQPAINALYWDRQYQNLSNSSAC